jgi:hypothetical protein
MDNRGVYVCAVLSDTSERHDWVQWFVYHVTKVVSTPLTRLSRGQTIHTNNVHWASATVV